MSVPSTTNPTPVNDGATALHECQAALAAMREEKDRLLRGALFSDAELEGRYVDLLEMAESFLAGFNRNRSVGYCVDPARLYMVVVSAYDDIARYKFYHLTDPVRMRSDAIKRAAYLTKWIIRFRPLVSDASASIAKDDVVAANETFAIMLSLSNVRLLAGRRIRLSAAKWYELLYELIYRDFTADSLMLFYQIIVDIARGKNPILVSE